MRACARACASVRVCNASRCLSVSVSVCECVSFCFTAQYVAKTYSTIDE